MKKRKLKKSAVIFLSIIGALIIFLIVFLANFNFKFINKNSIHSDALSYKTREALVFYPDCEIGKQKAKEIAKNADEDEIIDYALIPYGDYNLVKYNCGVEYFIDHNGKELVIDSVNDQGKIIISDYLRYSMKKDEIDIAYSYDFLVETCFEKIDLSNVTYQVKDAFLNVHFDNYEYDVQIPLKYMQEPCGINLGYTNEKYVKPRYVSNNHKMIAFTFDDGPDMSLKTSGQIVDKLYKFDSSATFFILGNRLGEKQINFCKESVEKGIEYGSHTQNHPYLTDLTGDQIKNEVMTPYHDLCDNEFGFGYEMKLFRPPYGSINNKVREVIDLTAVLWNVDSLDWSYRTQFEHDECVDVICDKVIKETDKNDVVLFHDIYQTSADAACRLIEHYIKEGYQLVSVSELMKALGKENVKSFSGQ